MQLPAAAAAQLAAEDAPTPRLLLSAGPAKLTPRTNGSVDPSPAAQFPRSHPLPGGSANKVSIACLCSKQWYGARSCAADSCHALPPSRVEQAGGTPQAFDFSSWLRMSSHLSKPEESPEASLSASSDGEEGDTRDRTVAALDFAALGAQEAASPAPAAASPAKPVKQAQAAKPVEAAPAAAPALPAARPAARQPAAARRSGPTALGAVLLMFLLALLLLASPVALVAYTPALSQRLMPGGEQRWREVCMALAASQEQGG